jgi:integrase
MPKVPKKTHIRKIVAEQFERLYQKAGTLEWKVFIATAWYTGMRRNEMLDLTWDKPDMPRIDFAVKKVWIPAAYNTGYTPSTRLWQISTATASPTWL